MPKSKNLYISTYFIAGNEKRNLTNYIKYNKTLKFHYIKNVQRF